MVGRIGRCLENIILVYIVLKYRCVGWVKLSGCEIVLYGYVLVICCCIFIIINFNVLNVINSDIMIMELLFFGIVDF